ncbi:MAG TPA: hypothetical protein DCP91_09735 [Eggerthellaceae bacterium]|nr:hypothetical protein [Eggerthellaceae bacterium]
MHLEELRTYIRRLAQEGRTRQRLRVALCSACIAVLVGAMVAYGLPAFSLDSQRAAEEVGVALTAANVEMEAGDPAPAAASNSAPTAANSPQLARPFTAQLPFSSNPATDESAFAAASFLRTQATPLAIGSTLQREAAYPAIDAQLPHEGDGSDIERISVRWISEDHVNDNNADLLSLAPEDNGAQSMQFQLEAALSGQYDYEPGDIVIRIPRTIWTSRSGLQMGKMELSVPEAPVQSVDFNYRIDKDYYVISNARAIPATSKWKGTFTITGITPSMIVDNSVSKDLTAVINVRTHEGNWLGLKSNTLRATMDTFARLTSANKSGSIYEEYYYVPQELQPANPEKYIYVRWHAYAGTNANQPNQVSMLDTPDQTYHPILLGYEDGARVVRADFAGSSSGVSSYAGYTQIWMAYPRSQFNIGSRYDLKNTVQYTVTPNDGDPPTSKSHTSTVVYKPAKWPLPVGHFWTDKFSRSYGDMSEGFASYYATRKDKNYGYALNRLRKGLPVNMEFQVYTIGLTMPWTIRDGVSYENSTAADYGHKYVKMETIDNKTYFNFNDNVELTSTDFQISSVRLEAPHMMRYRVGAGKLPQSVLVGSIESTANYEVAPSGTVPYPDVQLYGLVNGSGDWVHFATARFSYDSSRYVHSVSIQAFNGATASGESVHLPQNVTDYKTVVNTNQAGLYYYTYPTITLKPSDSVRSQVETLFQQTENPKTKFRNDVVMYSYDSKGELIHTNVNYTRATLEGVAQKVEGYKGVTVTNDPAHMRAVLTYRLQMYDQTNIEDYGDYEAAVAEGSVTQQRGATWYDLLPAGVEPDMSTVAAYRHGDSVVDAYTIEDFRGSGRTLLVVKTELTPDPFARKSAPTSLYPRLDKSAGMSDVPEVRFNAYYTWDKIDKGGTYLQNYMAYESDDERQLGSVEHYKGEPDNPLAGFNAQSRDAVAGVEDLMTDLDPTSDRAAFVYANCSAYVNPDMAALTSLRKTVTTKGLGYYTDGLLGDDANVFPGQEYTYQLALGSSSGMVNKNIVLYDSLDNYVPTPDKFDYGLGQWRGSLVGVDVSALQAMGAAPVVYYSTVPGLVLEQANPDPSQPSLPANQDLSDRSVWSATPPADLSQVTAIAIDASKRVDGTDFELKPGERMSVYITMRAPDEDAAQALYAQGERKYDPANNHHAYNNAFLTCVQIDAYSHDSSEQFIRNDYTKVGISPFRLNVVKKWRDAADNDRARPDSVTISLLRNGQDTGKSLVLNEANEWKGAFDGLSPEDAQGNAYHWSFNESYPEGQGLEYRTTVAQTAPGTYTITNRYDPKTVVISGSKTWNDTTAVRPKQVGVNLVGTTPTYGQVYFASEDVKPDSNGSWNYEFSDMRRYFEGEEVTYSVSEDYVDGYVYSVLDGYNLHNTYDPYADISIQKKAYRVTDASKDAEFSFVLYLTKKVPGASRWGQSSDSTFGAGDPVEGLFAYDVIDLASGNVVRTGEVAHGGTVSCTAGQRVLVHDVPSETDYRIVEEDAEGFKLLHASGQSGTLKARQTAEALFENSYQGAGSVILHCGKDLDGRSLPAYLFRFLLKDSAGNIVRIGYNDRAGDVYFGTLSYGINDLANGDGTYATERTFSYTIEELNDGRPGFTYDSRAASVKVRVVDVGGGVLQATPTYYGFDGQELGDTPPVFQNEYHATGAAEIKAWKTLKGSKPADGQFSFELLDESGQVVRTAANNADGVVNFDPIPYSEADVGKQYRYTVREVNTGQHGVVYSTQTYTYLVSIADNSDGTLAVSQTVVNLHDGVPVPSDEVPVFVNELEPGNLRVEKLLQDYTLEDLNEEFTFTVRLLTPDGSPVPDGTYGYELSGTDLQPPEPKMHTVTFGAWDRDSDRAIEADGCFYPERYENVADGSTIEAPKVQRAPDGYNYALASALEWHTADGEPFVFEGTPVYDDIVVYADFKKGGQLPSAGGPIYNPEIFTYAMLKDDGTLMFFQSEQTLANNAIANVNLGDDWWPEYARGRVFTVNTTSTGATAPTWQDYKSQIKHVDTYWSQAVFAKSYANWFSDCPNLESINLSQFNTRTYASYDYTTGQVTYDYTTNLYRMFYNCPKLKSLDLAYFYTAGATNMTGMLSGCTGLESLKLGSGFSFRGAGSVLATAAGLPGHEATNTHTDKWVLKGSTTAPALTSTQLMQQYNTGYAGTWLWEPRPVNYKVLFDKGHADAIGTMPYQAHKVDEAKTLAANRFVRFGYDFAGWATQPGGDAVYEDGQSVTNVVPVPLASDGVTTTFYAVWQKRETTATVNDGLMTLTLRGGESALIQGLPAGTSYQIVEASKPGWSLVGSSGATGVVKSLETSEASFTNKPADDQVSVTLAAAKTLDGAAPETGRFSFTLSRTSGSANRYAPTAAQTKTNVGAGVTFDALTFTGTGTWTFDLREVVPSGAVDNGDGTFTLGDVVYDGHVETVRVQVVRNSAGKLEATVSYDDDGAVFANETPDAPEPGVGSLTVGKTVQGASDALDGREYAFAVHFADEAGAVPADAQGQPLKFAWTRSDGQAGTIASGETVLLADGQSVQFADVPEGLRYRVVESADSALRVTSTGDRGVIVGGGAALASFTNTYAARGTADLVARKVLQGATLEAGQFSFELRDEGGTVLRKATNDESGAVAFGTLDYALDGTFAAVAYGQAEDRLRAAIPVWGKDGVAYGGSDVPAEAVAEIGHERIIYEDATPEQKQAAGEWMLRGVVYGPAIPDDACAAYKAFGYTIAEAVPADTGSIIYDVRQWPVEVLVSDAGDGVLRSHVRYQDPVGGQENEQAAEFLNRVKPGKLRVGKVAVGMTDAAADVRFLFRIDLSDADGNELLDGEGAPLAFAYKIIGQADNDSASALTDALGAPRVGSIASGGQVLLGSRESLLVEGLPAGASYSVVELPTDGFQLVSHDGERGRIEADATAQARFNNVYRAEGSAVLRAHKTLLNGEEPMEVLGERTFTFELRDEFGEVVDSRTTGIDGSVEFEALQFSAADVGSTYTYFIREVDDGQQSVVYDTHSEKVMVSVSDPDGTGVLKVDVLYAAQLEAILAGETPDVNYIPEFVNIYDESFNLPETGGPGAFAPLLAGLALSAASLVLLRRRYRQAP